ncbi:MAG: hypothetical protein A3D74_02380 [Candidatus Levybacteria bacterium RIFCSPHIGHO2_02_FULL_37_13]|nr:MAG: hypothetical protein A3D74_02380 [Candidatus Levybacteria bacterium RIFCSPHIGHO2_02_FULL_37_13]OGH29577.1 MAG: hypothetical protein A3E40_04785 [Candidatus Levybacteria bacterium RIFCSPHIGHO2_12_FULL_37_9]OGH39895.1 MAG: hypothetical protein A3B41_02390 [Candidatus Levybacteria bacterium RIFCSPLOWO2_01_FULL_37_26]
MDALDPEKTVLIIKTPKAVENSFEKFKAFFTDLHKFVKDKRELNKIEKTVSFELILKENYLHYRIVLNTALVPIVKSLFYAQFPETEVIETEMEDVRSGNSVYLEYGLKRSNYFPLKTGFSEEADPYLMLAAVSSKLEHFNEGVVLQLVLLPFSESWGKQFLRQNFSFITVALNKIKLFLEKPFLTLEHVDYSEEIQNKFIGKKLFFSNFRVFAYAKEDSELQENVVLTERALEKFSNSVGNNDINKFKKINKSQEEGIYNFSNRMLTRKKMILNAQELATIFHFPNSGTNIKTTEHVKSKRIEPPKALPIAEFITTPNVSVFANTWSKGNKLQFGVKRIDRSKHLYIIGKTGMGKSRLIELLTLSDTYQDKGFCVIDAHGDLATDILRFIPKRRIEDVIYFNPSDSEYPIGFNPLECFTPEDKHQVVTGFVSIFKKLFASNWTNRLEHVLRFTVLALIEAGNATILDIVKLLTDITFRQSVIKRIEDPVVKNFWTHEFSSWNEKFDNEAIIPIINQIGQFLSNDYIRNVVGQKKSRIDFYKSMNSGKIIIINLAKGKLGEDNASLLGSMIITKIQEAAMARVNIRESERREFYLYVDEFQNFATESFNQILSEARKFNLSLTIAHQYIDQLTDSIRKTAFGNVGSLICFRVGSEDAHFLSKEFAPQFTPDDLIGLDMREMCVKLSIDGKTSEPFSAVTLDVPEPKENFDEEIIAYSRKEYAISKKDVEKELFGENKETMTHIAKEKTSYSSDDVFEEPLVN